jgi:hypothetical protein
MKRVTFFVATIITSNLKRAHSKALESGCLSRFSLPPLDYDKVFKGEESF